MTTSTDIVNQALQLIGDDGPQVTGAAPSFDDSDAGIAAASLYAPCVQTVARRFGWDFSRNTAALALSGNAAPSPWSYEYLYPPFGVEIRQLLPTTIADSNDPLPVNWSVANNTVAGVSTKVVQTDFPDAMAVFTNQPNENTWDSIFREAVVRLLASEFADALVARPDTSAAKLQEAIQFMDLGATRES